MGPIRLFLFRIHKWVGFILALYFVAVFLTGTILVLREDVDTLLYSGSRLDSSAAEPAQAFPAHFDALKAHDDAFVVVRIIRPEALLAGDYAIVWSPEHRFQKIWLDPLTSALLSVRSDPGFVEYVRKFHDSLFVPNNIGYLFVTGMSATLMVSLVSGLTSYRRFWRGLFRLPAKSGTGRMRHAGWHRLLALWSLPFLCAIAVTGFVYFLSGLGLVGEGGVGNRTLLPDLAPGGTDSGVLKRAIEVAEAQVPGMHIGQFYNANVAGETFLVVGERPTGGLFGAVSVSVHLGDFSVLRVESMSDKSAAYKALTFSEMLHFGHWYGGLSRWLWVAFGLMACALPVFGTLVRLSRGANTGNGYWRGMWQELRLFGWLYAIGVLLVAAAFVVTEIVF